MFGKQSNEALKYSSYTKSNMQWPSTCSTYQTGYQKVRSKKIKRIRTYTQIQHYPQAPR